MNIELLKKTDLFSSFSDEELEKIIHRLSIKTYPKNSIFMLKGVSNDQMYIVLTGKVKVTLTNRDARDLTLAIRQAGDFFGEMSLIDDQTTSAAVSTIEDATIALLSKDIFWELISSNNKFQKNLLHVLCARIRENNRVIERLTYNKATERLKMFFMEYSRKFGKNDGEAVVLEIKLTHQDIADMTGLLRETVTNTIIQWKQDDYITLIDNKYYRIALSLFEEV